MLAGQLASQVRALYPDRASFTQRHERGPQSLSELRGILTRTRTDGYAREDGTVTPDLSSIAVAITDRTGRSPAAIAVTFRSREATDEHVAALVAHTRTAARDVERRLRPSLVKNPGH